MRLTELLKRIKIFAVIPFAIFLYGCEGDSDLENAAEDAGDEMKEMGEDTADAVEDAADETKDAVKDATN